MKKNYDRRDFFKTAGLGVLSMALSGCAGPADKGDASKREDGPEAKKGDRPHLKKGDRPHFSPNIILVMSDDQGWGDAGYMGHPILKTPNLDEMAKGGIRFHRFYSAAPVCSPTRGSCLTGRHPYRYGIFSANKGHMPPEEVTLAEVLKGAGYTTGHFGKWHLGTLTKIEKDSNRGGPEGVKHYSPPWENGFDTCFSTEAKVPTWDPMVDPENPDKLYGTHYWTGPEEKADHDLEGDDSRIIMDRAIPFIQDAAEKGRPFFAVIWFHTPHAPVIAGPEYRESYPFCTEDEQHYFGCITAMDDQIGRLRGELKRLGVADDTLIWFCSDNGPEGKKPKGRNRGSAGPFRGRKRSLFEGGIRVPAVLEWPAMIEAPRAVELPCCTSDFFHTFMDVLGTPPAKERHLDGVSLLPLIQGTMKARPRSIAFESGKQTALIDNRFKIISTDKGETYLLFDLVEDPGEQNDIASEHPHVLEGMKGLLLSWQASCTESRERSK